MRHWLPLLLPFGLGFAVALLLWGCAGNEYLPSTAGAPARQDIIWGDRQKDWALVYYQSWLRDRNHNYLRLARREMAASIRTYFEIQVRIGHSYPDFYIVDRKRREGCLYLSQIDRDAGKFRVVLDDTGHEGCLVY